MQREETIEPKKPQLTACELMKKRMVACFGAFFTIHPLGKCATRSPALRSPAFFFPMLRCSSSRGGSPRRRRALPGTAGAALASAPNWGF